MKEVQNKKLLGKNEKKMLIIVGILLCITLIVGISYAWWTYTTRQKSTNIIKSNCLEVDIIDETSAISLIEAYPMTDVEANSLAPYVFTIKNVCNTSIVYDVNRR